MIVADPVTFAQRLKELREAAGMTQYRLAQTSGLSKQTISQLEKGTNEPSWDTVRKLARALGIATDDFDTASDQAEPDDTPPPPPKKPAPKKPKR
ncbi:helix-turn-helix domain-containing protein [Gemmata sp.]|uniref:helix-turn-helix domain-containing protein n=1 Tax=Gemmata sp. TaxID=1914242 RepID=UPI003F7226B7